MGQVARACPPLELVLDDSGRRCLPLSSLRHVLEWQLQAAPEEASLERLLEAVEVAEEAPLPGHTPARAMTEQEVAEAKDRDPEPQPTDGPDYHADHAFWKERQRGIG